MTRDSQIIRLLHESIYTEFEKSSQTLFKRFHQKRPKFACDPIHWFLFLFFNWMHLQLYWSIIPFMLNLQESTCPATCNWWWCRGHSDRPRGTIVGSVQTFCAVYVWRRVAACIVLRLPATHFCRQWFDTIYSAYTTSNNTLNVKCFFFSVHVLTWLIMIYCNIW